MDNKTLKYIGVVVFTLIIATIAVVLVLLYFLGSFSTEALPREAVPRIVIDHDGGADDAMAIFMVLLYEKYFQGPNVVGLTTSHGNVNENQVFENSQRILDIAGRREVPIYRGSNFSLVETFPTDFFFGHDGLGDNKDVSYAATEAQPGHAAIALVELSKKYPGELIVVAIGALTNIALAVRLDPLFISRLSQLYVGAGKVHSEEFPDAEFNALIDVEAYHVVAENSSPDKVTAIPFSTILTHKNTSMDWRQNVLGAIPTEIMRAQNSFERLSQVGKDTWTLLDPAVLGIVLDRNLVNEYIHSDNSIILCGDQRGINTNHFTEQAKANVKLVFDSSEEEYKQLLIDIFSAELK